MVISDDFTADVNWHVALTGVDIPVITVYLPTGVSDASIAGCNHAYAVRSPSVTSAAGSQVPSTRWYFTSSWRHPPVSPSCSVACGSAYPRRRRTKTYAATGTNRRS